MFVEVLQACEPMTSNDTRAFWVTGPGRGEIRSESLSAPADGELLVRTQYSGISRGTEAIVFNHRVPPSEYEHMRAPFQVGAFPSPVKYGYANVGVVEEGPADCKGRYVFCLYPHQTRYIVPMDAVHYLPETVPPARAVLAANLETAVNALWDAAPTVGDRVAVVGAGSVGSLLAWLINGIPGTEVELIDIDGAKREIAAALNVAFRQPRDATPNADLVCHTSASADGLATALELAGFEATVLELSWYGNDTVPVPLGAAFHSRRLQLRSSQVGTIANSQRQRWDTKRRMALVMRLLEEPSLDALITGESSFDELPGIMQTLANNPAGALCHRITYR